MQFGLVTDAGCSLTTEMCREMQIVRVPAGITADGKVYADDDGLNMDVLDAALSAAKTSSAAAPSPENYISAFEKAEKDGARGIAVLTMSNVFSDSYFSAMIAARLFTRDGTNGRQVKVIDSGCAGAMQDQLLLKMVGLREKGQSLEEVLAAAEEGKRSGTAICLPGDLERLFHTGRMPLLSSVLLRKINVFSVLACAENGSVQTGKKRYGRKKALEDFRNACIMYAPGKDLVLLQQDAEEETERIRGMLPDGTGKVTILRARGLMGYFLERGGIMASFMG